MGVITSSSRVWHTHRPAVVACFIVLVLVLLWRARSLLYETWTLAALPFLWSRHASHFYLSPDADGFDISFANYSVDQTDAAPFPDRVPPILHHISLGSGATENAKWAQGRQSCLDLHPDWEAFLWTDDVVETFVASHFPEIYGTWKSYRYLVQRVDALRYMVLYHYGGMFSLLDFRLHKLSNWNPLTGDIGVILDMDLECKRALGPLRRFEFVAPAAHPTGFSIGFMMASKRNEYVGSLVANLPRYNRHWLGLPYPAVMFSTGCHYAS